MSRRSAPLPRSPDEYEIYLKQRGEDFRVFHEIWERMQVARKANLESDIDNAIRAVRKRHAPRSS